MQLKIQHLCAALALVLTPIVSIGDTAPIEASPGYLAKLASQESEFEGLQKSDTPESERKRSMLTQRYATTLSWVGKMQESLEVFDDDRQLPYTKPARKVDTSGMRAEDAIAAIVEQAKTRQIVILNEAHHVPMHHAFAMRLARELRKLGFEYLACEAFSARLDKLLPEGYPRRIDGYYLQEPHFAEFARDARKDGWKLLGYDAYDPKWPPEEQPRLREQGAAQNLYDGIWRQNPKAKAFIYVGYTHGNKAVGEFGPLKNFLFMGGQLKKLTGLDPLVVDQTVMYSHVKTAFEDPAYRSVVEALPRKAPFVLWDREGASVVFSRERAHVDLQVIWPVTQIVDGRPAWQEAVAERRAVEVPVELLPQTGRRLIYAFHSEDGAYALPVATVVVQAGQVVPKIMAPKGNMRFGFED